MIGVQKMIKLTYNFGLVGFILIIMIFQCYLSFIQNTIGNWINFVIGMILGIYLNKELIRKIIGMIGGV